MDSTQDPRIIQRYIEAMKSGGATDEQVAWGIKKNFGIDVGGAPQGKSLAGFAGNVGRDIGENVQGLLNIPGLLGQILSGQANLGDVGSNMATGIFNDYKDLVTKPVDTAYDKPVTTLLNVIPFLGLGKSLLGGVGKAAKAADTASDLSKLGKAGKMVASLPDDLQDAVRATRGVTKAKNVGEALESAGTGIRRGVAGFGAKEGARWFDDISDKLNMQKTLGMAGSPEQQLRQIGLVTNAADSKIRSLLPTIEKKAAYTKVIKNFTDELELAALDTADSGIKKAIQSLKNRVRTVFSDGGGSAQNIYSLKSQLRSELDRAFTTGNFTNPNMVKEAMFNGLKTSLDDVAPQLRNINTFQHQIYEIGNDLMKQVTPGYSARIMGGAGAATLGGILPSGPIKAGEDAIGRLLQRANNPVVNTTGKVVGGAVGGAVGAVKNPLTYLLGRNIAPQGGEASLEQGLIKSGATQQMGDETSGETTQEAPKKEVDADKLKTTFSVLMLKDLALTGGKYTNQLNTVYKMLEPATNKAKKLSAVAAKEINRNMTALNSLNQLEGELAKSGADAKMLAASLPFAPGARVYRAAWGSIIDAIGTNRTGAAYTKEQRKDYDFMLPKVGDSPETIQTKINAIREELTGYVRLMNETTSATDIMDEVYGQGLMK